MDIRHHWLDGGVDRAASPTRGKEKGLTFKESFAPSCMVVSIIIGAVAGIVGVISLNIDAAAPVSTARSAR